MSGYWRRVVADYVRGQMTGGSEQRFFVDSFGEGFYDSSNVLACSRASTVIVQLAPNIILTPFYNPRNQVFPNMAVNVTTAVALGKMRLGVYEDLLSPVAPYEFRLVHEYGEVTTNVLGFRATVLEPTDFELPQGFYWLASLANFGCSVSSLTVNKTIGVASLGFSPSSVQNPRFALKDSLTLGAYGPLPQIIQPEVWDSLAFNASVQRAMIVFSSLAGI